MALPVRYKVMRELPFDVCAAVFTSLTVTGSARICIDYYYIPGHPDAGTLLFKGGMDVGLPDVGAFSTLLTAKLVTPTNLHGYIGAMYVCSSAPSQP